jgi:hypothetical protein
MNSVDFKLHAMPGAARVACVAWRRACVLRARPSHTPCVQGALPRRCARCSLAARPTPHAPTGQPLELLLNCAMRRKHGPAETNHMSLRGATRVVAGRGFARVLEGNLQPV